MTEHACRDNPPASEDALLGGRVRLLQPVAGYRVAVDPVFLAAAVPARKGERVLDLGCGTGAAALCLARRVGGVDVTGLDIQADLVGLARRSAGLNGLSARMAFVVGDLLAPPLELAAGGFDHVMANPPYLRPGTGKAPPNPARAAATVEGAAGLADWARAALSLTRPGGSVTFIHRHDRARELAQALENGAGAIAVHPLWPRQPGAGARRALVQAIKGAHGPERLADGLVVHDAGGGYTPAADDILRNARPLTI